jgi:surface antigen
MTNITQGMNIDEVRRLASDLEALGGQIDQLVQRIERAVGGASWVGPDASTFKGTWWPGHRTHLATAAEDLRGFGRSAKNNADEQAQASGAGAGAASGTAGSGSGGIGTVVTPAPGAPSVGPIGTPPGMTPSRSWQDVDAAYRARGDLGGYGAGGAYGYQCTSWAYFRWRELGYHGNIGNGNGWEMAANNGGSAQATPSLHAMASYGTKADYGHVMIVEEVRTGPGGHPVIRVSEFNTGSDGSSADAASAREYLDTRTWTQLDNGSWQRSDGKVVPEIRFAGFPG